MIKYLSPEVLLFAYQQGLFPMAEGRNAKQIQWIQPEKRGIFQLGNFHISKSLRRVILKRLFNNDKFVFSQSYGKMCRQE